MVENPGFVVGISINSAHFISFVSFQRISIIILSVKLLASPWGAKGQLPPTGPGLDPEKSDEKFEHIVTGVEYEYGKD